jgi:hypothetical protein
MLKFLTFGFPMKLIEDNRFIDIVNGKTVNLYEDTLGRTYLAYNKWDFNRVGINPTVDLD